MNHKYASALALSAALLATPVAADGLLHWTDTSLSYLYGTNYAVNPPIQQTGTFEHASGWAFGDLFTFVDYVEFNGQEDFFAGDSSYYGEFSPRFSIGKIFNAEFKGPVFSDVLLATTYEFGENDVETLLVGPGFDLKVPGFDFFQLNVYKRFPRDGRDGETIQITPVWAMTFPVGSSDIIFDGFIDWNVDSDGSYKSNIHVNPQLKYDVSKAIGWKAKRVLVGTEYSYWSNKYGIKDSKAFNTDESVFSLILKSHF